MNRSFVRKVIMGSLLMMVAMFVATAAHGQYLPDHLTAKIPFDFVVGNEKLPAGKYLLGNAQTTSDSVLAIRSGDGIANTLTIPVQIGTPTDKAMLIFRRYGDQYFLLQIWQAGATTGRAVPKSDAERDLERKARLLAPVGAANTKTVETVLIVAFAH